MIAKNEGRGGNAGGGQPFGKQTTTPEAKESASKKGGPKKPPPKVRLLVAVVVNLVTLLILAIVLLVLLLPAHSKVNSITRAVKGADDTWIVVKISESQVRANGLDFLSAQDGLQSTLQSLSGSGNNTIAYVRDTLPDSTWISQNLPADLQTWLRQLYGGGTPGS
jgi:competence protein ComGC